MCKYTQLSINSRCYIYFFIRFNIVLLISQLVLQVIAIYETSRTKLYNYLPGSSYLNIRRIQKYLNSLHYKYCVFLDHKFYPYTYRSQIL